MGFLDLISIGHLSGVNYHLNQLANDKINEVLNKVAPELARDYKQICLRFLNGKLIYRPNPDSDVGKIELLIADLQKPLEGEFDLSHCGDTGKFLSINTGYRKGKRATNANKVEIWLAPRFLIERQLSTTTSHYIPIMSYWDGMNAPVGQFWTWGNEASLDNYDYSTTNTWHQLGNNNLYDECLIAAQSPTLHYGVLNFLMQCFRVHF